MIAEMLQLMGEIVVLMLAGWFLRWRGIVTDSGRACLTDLIMYAILPCNILHAFLNVGTGTAGIGASMGMVLLISILIQILCTVIGHLCYPMMRESEKPVYQYGTVCSNAGFMGNPMAQTVFGDLGLLYGSVYLIPQRIVMWTAGVSYFAKEGDRGRQLRKTLVHPCMLGVYAGMFLMLSGLSLPGFLEQSISALSSCTTAMTMVYIGTILYDADWQHLFSFRQLYYAALRLVIIPLIVYLPCLFLEIDPLVTGVSVFLAAMPAGSTTSLLAAKYKADEDTAAKCVVLTTALSAFTLPIWGIFLTAAL